MFTLLLGKLCTPPLAGICSPCFSASSVRLALCRHLFAPPSGGHLFTLLCGKFCAPRLVQASVRPAFWWAFLTLLCGKLYVSRLFDRDLFALLVGRLQGSSLIGGQVVYSGQCFGAQDLCVLWWVQEPTTSLTYRSCLCWCFLYIVEGREGII